MLTDKIKELEVTRTKLASLEKTVQDELNKELAGLPAKYGFSSAAEFVHAVQSAGRPGNGPRRGRKLGAPKSIASAPKTGRKRRTRAVITDEMRARVRKLVNEGKTGLEIAKEVGISLPSVQNIKKSAGLVGKTKRGRKPKASKD